VGGCSGFKEKRKASAVHLSVGIQLARNSVLEAASGSSLKAEEGARKTLSGYQYAHDERRCF